MVIHTVTFLMKPAGIHITLFILALAGMFVYSPCHAQDSNMRFWEAEKQAIRSRLSDVNVNYIFRSRVISDSTLNSVRDCHIINTTQHLGTVTDAYGDFKITANPGDSITFSALGYERLMIVLTDTMYNYGYTVKLKPKAYELEEVTVRPFNIKLPEISKYEIYTPPLPGQGGINIPLPGVMASPVTALYNRFSREGRQRRYYKKVTEGTADFMLIGEKFNGELVSQITGLKDDELIRFISFCDFSSDFLMNYSPETIKRAIRTKYAEYREGKGKTEERQKAVE
jgi:hypothetical protein